jgi:hypothetical protein
MDRMQDKVIWLGYTYLGDRQLALLFSAAGTLADLAWAKVTQPRAGHPVLTKSQRARLKTSWIRRRS